MVITNYTFKLKTAANSNNIKEKNYLLSRTSSISSWLNWHIYPKGLSKYNIIIESLINIIQHKVN